MPCRNQIIEENDARVILTNTRSSQVRLNDVQPCGVATYGHLVAETRTATHYIFRVNYETETEWSKQSLIPGNMSNVSACYVYKSLETLRWDITAVLSSWFKNIFRYMKISQENQHPSLGITAYTDTNCTGAFWTISMYECFYVMTFASFSWPESRRNQKRHTDPVAVVYNVSVSWDTRLLNVPLNHWIPNGLEVTQSLTRTHVHCYTIDNLSYSK